MRHTIFASIFLTTFTACNPCDIEVVSDTAFIAPGCPQGTNTGEGTAEPTTGAATSEDTSADESASGSASSTSVTTTGDADYETDDDCDFGEACNEAHECVKKGPPPTCIAVPQGGEAWGPCFIGSTCNPGAECHDIGPGNVCVPPCADDTCPAFKCLNGTCDAAAECTPTCANTEDCPIDGMFCFGGECLYPAFAPLP